MEKEKKTFVDWVKKHKIELIIAGFSITAIIAVILGIKNHKALEEVWASLRKLVEKTPKDIPSVKAPPISAVDPIQEIIEISIPSTGKIPHDVCGHPRNLPKGWKASAEKIARAAEYGYELQPGQTWVEPYRTGGLAA